MIDFPAVSAGDLTVKRETPVSFPDGPTFEVVSAEEKEAIPRVRATLRSR